MTVIDLLIITVTLAALWICYLHRRELLRANLHRGLSILVVGILVIGLLYLVDLLIMWVLPWFVAQATAMTTMTDLHLNYSWPIMLAGILCLFAGFAYTIRGLLTQTSDLKKKTDQFESTNRELHVEIVERMQVEGALRKSEQRYRAVVDAQTEIISRSLPDTTLTFVNEAYCKYFGKEADEVIGQSFLLFVVPEAREAARAHFASLVEEPRRVIYEHEVLLPDGLTAWNEWIDTPILDEEGRVVEFQSVGRDITERKRAEEALRKSEERFAKAFHNSPDAIGITSLKDGRIIEANEGFERFSGYSREEVLGRTVLDLGLWATPDERASFVEMMEALGRIQNLDLDVRIKSGEVRRCLAAAEIIELDEETCLAVFIRDITERKRAEEALRESEARYSLLVKNAHAGIWRVAFREPLPTTLPVEEQIDWIFTHAYIAECNDAYAKTFGLDTAQAAIGQDLTVLVSPLEAANRDRLRSFIASGYERKNMEGTFVNLNGHARTTLQNAFSMIEDGRLHWIWGVQLDITARKRAEEVLRESEEKFATAFRAHPDAAVITSLKDNRLTEVNDGFERMFGYSRQEALGRTSLNLNLWVDLEERARLIETLRREGRVNSWELGFRTKAGEERIADLSVESIELGGEPCGLTIVHDITERKKTEEALREYTERLKVLREIDRAILAAESSETIAEVGLQHVHQLGPCAYANVVIFDDEAQEAQVNVFQPDVVERDRPSMENISGVLDLERLRQGEVHRVVDIRDLPQTNPFTQLFKAMGIRSLFSVPLMAQGHLIGALTIGFDQPDAYTDQNTEIARQVADSLAVAIQHARLFRQVREANTRLQSLSRQLVQAQEAERRHLARELHDQIGQTLTAVKLSLQAVRDGFDDASNLDEHIHTVSHALDQVRTLSLDLRPSMLDDLGLAPALRWYVERQTRQANFEGLVVADEWEQRLSPELEVTCFRVVQEALTNIVRHAGAQRVRVEVRRTDKEVELIIEDDGKGFDVEQALARAVAGTSLGLLGMEERVHLAGGRLKIHSQAGHGTEIRVRFPVNV